MWALLSPVIALALAWLVGNRLTDRWDVRKKTRELDLAALSEFYRLYGEFFSLWKLWDHALGQPGELGPRREVLLDRSAAAEGQMEALLIRIASERRLTLKEQHILGAFRQGYKRVRKAIQNEQSLNEQGWSRSGAPGYAAFKGLASSVAVLLAEPRRSGWVKELVKPPAGPDSIEARRALRQITSNVYEASWRTPDGRQRNVWVAVAANLGLLDFQEPHPSEAPVYQRDDVLLVPAESKQEGS